MKLAYAYAADVPLKPNEFRLLAFMALTALDNDNPPRYFDSREASALALGRRVPDPDPESEAVELARKAAFSAVRESVDGLVKLGAIDRTKVGRIGTRAEFTLRFDLARTRLTKEFKTRDGADGRRKSLSLERRKSLSLQRRKSLQPGIGDSSPQGERKEPLGLTTGNTSGTQRTSLVAVDNSDQRSAAA